MKKLSIIIAALGLAIFVFDLLAFLQHWTFNYSKDATDILIDSGVSVDPGPMAALPALSFLLFAIAAFLASQSIKHKSLAIAGIVFLIMLVAYMFKIMHWPGASILLVLSFGAFIFVVIPWFTAFLLQDAPQVVEPEIEPEKE